MRTRQRQGRVDFSQILMGLVALTGLWAAWAFLPPQWAARKMENVTILTLHDWNKYGKPSAVKELPKIMDEEGIPEYIWPEDCDFWEETTDKHIDCYWEVDVMVPFTEKLVKTLEFEVHYYLDNKGEPHNWFEE